MPSLAAVAVSLPLEYRQCKRLFPPAASPDRSHRHPRSAASLTIERYPAGMLGRESIPATRSRARFSSFANRQANLHPCRTADSAAQTSSSRGCHPVSSNSPRCGGARHGGRIKASGSDAFASRWARIFSMTAGSSMHATIRTAAGRAGLDVDTEHPFQALRPGHRGAAFGRCRFIQILCRRMLTAPAPPSRCHPRTVFAVWRKHPYVRTPPS